MAALLASQRRCLLDLQRHIRFEKQPKVHRVPLRQAAVDPRRTHVSMLQLLCRIFVQGGGQNDDNEVQAAWEEGVPTNFSLEAIGAP